MRVDRPHRIEISSLLVLLAALGSIGFGVGCRDDEPAPPPTPDDATVRELSLGRLVGFESEDGAHVWRGIPFAAPPLGDLRWRAPRPPAPWKGTLEATEFGPPCIQFAGPAGSREGLEDTDTRGSEDCLYLNVFAPPLPRDDAAWGETGLPVMVWIHGGGNSIGDALIYDASRLAIRQSVIVVTIHYRLGVLGWFSHEALSPPDATLDDRSGNFGTLDAIAALQWVQEHIRAFGGDPSRVTVFGESAGGSDTIAMLISPRARGLFHGAIAQSGSGDTVEIAEARNAVDATPAGHEHSSSEVLWALLVADETSANRDDARRHAATMTNPEIADYLRSKSPSELLALYDGRLGGMISTPMLFRDGHVLPEIDARDAFARGEYNAVPAIFGTNRDETKLFQIFGSPHVARLSIMPLWFKNERMYDLTAEYGTKFWKLKGVDQPARSIAAAGLAPAYAYRFDWDEEGHLLWADLSRLLGAAHALEIPFVFGRLSLGRVTDNVFPESGRAEAERLSDQMMSYWGRFAHTGSPSRGQGGELPEWTSWTGDGGFIVFDTATDGGVRMSGDTLTRPRLLAALAKDSRFENAEERCEVYGDLVRFGRQLTTDEYRTIEGGLCEALPID